MPANSIRPHLYFFPRGVIQDFQTSMNSNRDLSSWLRIVAMSYRVPVARAPSSAGTSSESDSDERCSDWESSLGDARQTQSLFDNNVLPTPEAALKHDRSVHGFDLSRFVEDKGLDVYGRMRLINYIRKEVSARVEAVLKL